MKNYIKYAIGSVLLSAILGTILMVLVYLLPVNPIRNHIRESLPIYSTEYDVYCWAPPYAFTRIDNFTDSIMLNEAGFLGTGSVVNDAMKNPWMNYSDLYFKSESLIHSLDSDVLEKEHVDIYPRYWHGYLIWLKPLLEVMNVSDIRILQMCLEFLMLLFLVLEIYKQKGGFCALSVAVTFMLLNPVSAAMCMQYACMYFITGLSAIYLLRNYKKETFIYWKFFLWIGISTAFFDFLTYPLVAVGVNLAILSFMDAGQEWKRDVVRIIKSLISWGTGWAFMWASKWLIASVLTWNNFVRDGIENVQYRTTGGVPNGGSAVIGVIKKNVDQLVHPPIIILAVIMILVFILLLATHKYKYTGCGYLPVSLILIGILPLVWYGVVQNHSDIHPFLAYRNVCISVLCGMLLTFGSLEKSDEN